MKSREYRPISLCKGEKILHLYYFPSFQYNERGKIEKSFPFNAFDSNRALQISVFQVVEIAKREMDRGNPLTGSRE